MLIAAVGLLLFSLYDFLIPRTYVGPGQLSARPGATAIAEATLAATPVQWTSTPSPAPEMATAEPAVTFEPVGCFGTKFADKFVTGTPQKTTEGNTVTYASENVRIAATIADYKGAVVCVCDICVRDIANLSTSFAEGAYGKGLRDWAKNIAKAGVAIVAINGDYDGARSNGVVIRNGTLYHDDYADADVCVLYWDGTLEAYSPDDFDVDEAMARGAYQAWSFGSMLLDGAGQLPRALQHHCRRAQLAHGHQQRRTRPLPLCGRRRPCGQISRHVLRLQRGLSSRPCAREGASPGGKKSLQSNQ